MLRTFAVLAMATGLLLGATGCILVGTSTESRPTTGQQLLDLKTALDRGAITQAEYDTAKARLLQGK